MNETNRLARFAGILLFAGGLPAPEALRYLNKGHTKGKIIITVN
jgi:hypothetical protein